MREYNSGQANEKYKFTEKERDVETSFDYFGKRYYDPLLGVWLQRDPLWEKYHGWSPFNYTACNPLKYIDPQGMDLDYPELYFNKYGNFIDVKDDGKDDCPYSKLHPCEFARF